MHLRTAWNHIRRSPYQACAAILTMALTFFVAAVFFLAAIGIQTILADFEKQPQITAFFSDIKSEEDIRLLDEKLKGTGTVEKTVYISKEDALRIYQEQNKDDPLLLEMVTADILPASLEISATDPKHLEGLAAILEQEPGVEDVIYQKDVVDRLIAWTQVARTIGLVLVLVLATVSLLVLLTVISMKIALKREEIEILRLLGATNWYIRWPFLLEGGIYGVIAATLAWGASFMAVWYSLPFIKSFLTGIVFTGLSPLLILTLLGGLVAGGFLLGVIGSFFALVRYL
ncbi:FtsX-like permease family protein [Candidatus Roizmanbacteria bacterium]|nr:FtsX-like permease family protein [Candidatus Roizmanbacteria bacterium]